MEMQEIPKETEKAKEGDEGPSEPMLEVKKEGKKKKKLFTLYQSLTEKYVCKSCKCYVK